MLSLESVLLLNNVNMILRINILDIEKWYSMKKMPKDQCYIWNLFYH